MSNTEKNLLRLEEVLRSAKAEFYHELREAGYTRIYAGNMNQHIYRVHPAHDIDVRLAQDSMGSNEFLEYLESLAPGVAFKVS